MILFTTYNGTTRGNQFHFLFHMAEIQFPVITMSFIISVVNACLVYNIITSILHLVIPSVLSIAKIVTHNNSKYLRIHSIYTSSTSSKYFPLYLNFKKNGHDCII